MVPSILPQMKLTPQRFVALRKAEGVSVSSSFPAEKATVRIPANTTAKILLDLEFYTNAYPTLIFSGGKNGKITITYSEGLYDTTGAKNNRFCQLRRRTALKKSGRIQQLGWHWTNGNVTW